MPVPLRRKGVAGIVYRWVVHQPLFCQMLGVFSRNPAVDPALFWQAIQQHFRYGSIFSVRQRPALSAGFDSVEARTTHTLDLSVGYDALVQHYSRDRRLNLRRAERAGWTIVEDLNPEPLLTLFRQNHVDGIDGGVAEWAYGIFRNLVQELQKRRIATLRYALRDGQIEAGVLFVQEGGRIIYLFNAASESGRRGNARTLLLDQMIWQNAGRQVWFDFESPEKASIAEFYQSFGALAEPFWAIRWNRMNFMEKRLLHLKRIFFS
ncbi:GNAT family N-acetyltransferase [Spirosoma taeanense]|uniref:GNAT family N-acetyltransferase n=2 Tax=Spirosoma taeanense TaxID=2735870 RepID=A0A6M5YDZ4_9BACT|nr:GNAT family N-acetyltransferase [Spirosoma taeanense]